MTSGTHSLHVENRRLHKARAEVANDEGGDAEGDAVLTQRTDDQHLLKLITVILPVAWRENGRKGSLFNV